MKQRTLVQQYMTAIAAQIESEEEFSKRKNIVRAIIDRAIKESIIEVLPSSGERMERDERMLMLSPDFEVEEADLDDLIL